MTGRGRQDGRTSSSYQANTSAQGRDSGPGRPGGGRVSAQARAMPGTHTMSRAGNAAGPRGPGGCEEGDLPLSVTGQPRRVCAQGCHMPLMLHLTAGPSGAGLPGIERRAATFQAAAAEGWGWLGLGSGSRGKGRGRR